MMPKIIHYCWFTYVFVSTSFDGKMQAVDEFVF